MKPMRRFPFIIILMLFFFSTAQTQYLEKIELGSILSSTYIDGQSGNAPLTINDGGATFVNDWILFLGVEINQNLALYSEIQTVNVNGLIFGIYGLSAIYTPSETTLLNFEVGKFLVPFGTYLARRWASESPFFEMPLIYEYRSGLSAFELPGNESQLLRVRGQGQSFIYPDINQSARTTKNAATQSTAPRPGRGLRITSSPTYATGAQIFGGSDDLHYNFGIANGALSNLSDVNNASAFQFLGRLKYKPLIALDLGTSFSWGTYLNRDAVATQLQQTGKHAEDFDQLTLGVDASYSIGHLEFYSEAIFNRWETPFISENLNLLAFYLEAKYTFLTRFYLAGRFSRIDFADIDDPSDIDGDGQLRESWDFDINQWELGLGYHVNRHALLKIMGQFNRTQETVSGDPRDDFAAVQIVVFF